MLRTRMFSEMPGMPGRRQQMPRIDKVDRHAGLAGAIQRFDHAVIDQRVELGEDPRAFLPRRARSACSSISSIVRRCRSVGATTSFRHSCLCE